ncbi:MAG: tetratricopeptide repeat protein [Burkholderiaceae bacterium]|nr:tetratricopeptide repeat protein [Roseateles sp.]MBV8469881.1 tetratricopeptide repeat protein [Burkholderiaceae bacterium]
MSNPLQARRRWRFSGVPALALALLLAIPLAAAASELEAAEQQWLLGQKTRAIQTLDTALAQDPYNPKLRFNLALMLMEAGNSARAETLLRALTEDYPDLADPFNNLAVILAARGDLDGAQAALNRALLLYPQHAQALENLGDVYLQQATRSYEAAQKLGLAAAPTVAAKLKLTRELLDQLPRPGAR